MDSTYSIPYYVMSFCYFVHMCDADPVTNPWGCLPSWIARRPSNSNTRNSPSWSTFFWGRGFLWRGSFSRTSQITICQAWHRVFNDMRDRFSSFIRWLILSPDRTPMLDPWSFRKSGSGRESQNVSDSWSRSKSSRLSIPFFISVCVAELPTICIKLYQTWSFEPSKHSHHKLT